MVRYLLRHKDNVCGELVFDEKRGVIHSYHDNREGYSPFLGNCDYDKIRKWWAMRTVPASRNMIQAMIRDAGIPNAGSYLAKNLALSMTDTYWICPSGADIRYGDVQFTNFADYSGKIPYHNATSYDPNASLGGQMEKYWDLGHEVPILVKESSRFWGQQSVNEVFATLLHTRQETDVPFVAYKGTVTDAGSILCSCPAFTSAEAEFIPAYEIVSAEKIPNDQSVFEAYFRICDKHGIPEERMRECMDYMILTDFVISNTDEHLLNFGVLRNPDTMELTGPAPVFDSGNSMFYDETRRIPYTRAGILERKITGFYDSEEKMLSKVRNRNIVRADLLPVPAEVKDLYLQSGIPEWKTDFIVANYATKLQLFAEFQHGKKISLYREKQTEKQSGHPDRGGIGKFVMLCGIPGSGKTEQADRICRGMLESGMKEKPSVIFCTVREAAGAMRFIRNRPAVLDGIPLQEGYRNCVVRVSANGIREEISREGIQADNDLVLLIADARITGALKSGATVIYDASNLDRHIREHYAALAENAGAAGRILHVMHGDPEKPYDGIPPERMRAMAGRLESQGGPSVREGWDSITEHGPAPVIMPADDISL